MKEKIMQVGNTQTARTVQDDPEREIRFLVKQGHLADVIGVPEEHIVKVMMFVRDSFDACRRDLERRGMM